MNKVIVLIKTLPHYDQILGLPGYETIGSAGADLKCSFENRQPLVLLPGERTLITTGIRAEIPEGYELQIRPRSGLSLKTGLMILNSPGTIDSDYRGEIKVIIGNMGRRDEVIRHGDRIAQLVLVPISQAKFQITEEGLSATSRGEGGFGSTGKD
jgi:dUTP pyrophosphatase